MDAAEMLIDGFIRDVGIFPGQQDRNELVRRVGTLLSMQREALKAEYTELVTALKVAPCSCSCLTHESDWPQTRHFLNMCLFIKRLRQSGEPMDGPGEQPCEKKTCQRCSALAKVVA